MKKFARLLDNRSDTVNLKVGKYYVIHENDDDHYTLEIPLPKNVIINKAWTSITSGPGIGSTMRGRFPKTYFGKLIELPDTVKVRIENNTYILNVELALTHGYLNEVNTSPRCVSKFYKDGGDIYLIFNNLPPV